MSSSTMTTIPTQRRNLVPVLFVGMCMAAAVRLGTSPIDSRKLYSAFSREKVIRDNPLPPHPGCGMIDNATRAAPWIPYNEDELEFFELVEPCYVRLKSGARPLDQDDYSALHKLQCHDNGDTTGMSPHQYIQSTFLAYDRVLMVGDSILEQQYVALVCSLNPHLTREDIEMGEPGDWAHYEYVHHHHRRHHRYPDNNSNCAANMTTLTYRKVGWQFDNAQPGFYTTSYPQAIRNFTSNDAIILDAGAHFQSFSAHFLRKTVHHLTRLSTQTPAHVFYMEPTNSEWPTRNGMFHKVCMWICECEALTQDRIIGLNGALSDKRANYSHVNSIDTDPAHHFQTELFLELYPHLRVKSTKNNSTAIFRGNVLHSCFPECLPASWRVDLARLAWKEGQQQLLQENGSNGTHDVMIYVPIFWQMVALGLQTGKPSSHNTGDCTHKDFKSVLFMNDQLVRSMRERQREEQKSQLNNDN